MTNVTTVSIVSHSDPHTERDGKQEAIDRALSMVRSCSDFREFYRDSHLHETTDKGDPVVALESDEGRKRVANRLKQTLDKREANLQTILNRVEDAASVRDAAGEHELLDTSRQLGTWYHPNAAWLFDATDWALGTPILNDDHLDQIVEHTDDTELYLVETKLTY
jgi:hypothetical protein